MPEPRLHLDADASSEALHAALIERGHDVTRTPSDWVASEPSDEGQLLGATAHGRCIFTLNVRDFIVLAKRYPRHGGIILAAQSSWTLSGLAEPRVMPEALEHLHSQFDAQLGAQLVEGLRDSVGEAVGGFTRDRPLLAEQARQA